ncbi:NAD(P)/FAD-dependent oxidoreductase [Mycolicibacterium confluentis]|uniref:NAD(P)/FAD-dependent oxidoreductase n=1 Tax=Mycolicibacterium confluentis TaxID=28047 RepID=UPI000A1639C1|nr:FAD-binding oxidoreductase [Mycolicibacterium confluentis]
MVTEGRCAVTDRIDGGPRSVVVVGAGIVGLSTAWFLQERGVDVTVVDREGVGAGASWGNAGWIAPALAIPLNQPAVLRYGLASLLNPTAPLRISPKPDVGRARFLAKFASNCRHAKAREVVRANLPMNEECFEAFDVLTGNGVDVPRTETAITALFRDGRDADVLRHELADMRAEGQQIDVTELTGDALREQVPLAGPAATVGLAVENQRFVDPGRFVTALGDAVVERGASLHRFRVVDIAKHHDGVMVKGSGGEFLIAGAAVVATGAWLPGLTRRWRRTWVEAGRGYSFTVPTERPVLGPIYLPTVRVACTPYQGGLRVAGTMEFRDADDPVVPARVRAIASSAATMLDGVRWDEMRDVWVGPRPVSADGLPYIGELGDRVYVAGGHGMWGFAHGPITGRLLTEQITTGKQPEALAPFDPHRSGR